MNWAIVAAVAAGGAVGSAARYVMTLVMQRFLGSEFPWWTISVNVLGSFVMGVVMTAIADRWSVGQIGQAFIMVGILGGFTTFSAFSLDAVALLERNAAIEAGAYIIGSVTLSIVGLFAGIALTRLILA